MRTLHDLFADCEPEMLVGTGTYGRLPTSAVYDTIPCCTWCGSMTHTVDESPTCAARLAEFRAQPNLVTVDVDECPCGMAVSECRHHNRGQHVHGTRIQPSGRCAP